MRREGKNSKSFQFSLETNDRRLFLSLSPLMTLVFLPYFYSIFRDSDPGEICQPPLCSLYIQRQLYFTTILTNLLTAQLISCIYNELSQDTFALNPDYLNTLVRVCVTACLLVRHAYMRTGAYIFPFFSKPAIGYKYKVNAKCPCCFWAKIFTHFPMVDLFLL